MLMGGERLGSCEWQLTTLRSGADLCAVESKSVKRKNALLLKAFVFFILLFDLLPQLLTAFFAHILSETIPSLSTSTIQN